MSEFVESVGIWLPGTVLMLALVLCSAFFSASETAFFFLSRDQIRRFGAGNSRQRMVATLMADPDRLLTAVLFWNLLINLAYFTIGIVVIQKLTAGQFRMVAAVLGVLNLVGMIVLGEVTPKSVAVVFRQQIAPVASWPLAAAVRILDPVIPLLGRIAQILRRAFWPHVVPEPHLQPEDLEKAIDASAALASELLEAEQQVLHNILDLNEVFVEEIMRPRNLSITVAPEETLDTLSASSIAHVDYLMVKEDDNDTFRRSVALSRITGRTTATFAELSESVIYVPWCASLAYVLAELRNRYSSVAIVVHEHGEMVGTVNYEDLLETIFSDSPSRTRRILRREPLITIGDNRYHAEGLVTLRYLYRHLRISFDADEEALNTLAGLFHDELERLPQVGDCIRSNGWRFTAIEVSPRGQLRALIEPEEYSATETEDT
ncbi:MAG: CNNM domain-containing protein [Planctomycetaceae bacterium]